VITIRSVLTRFAFLFLALGALNVSAAASDPLSDDLVPDPSLTPEQVVRAQLEALKHNGDGQRGVAVAFRFAAPKNREMTGPVERFGQMLRVGQYALMFNYHDAVFDSVDIRGDKARLRVVLIGTNETFRYDFYLGRQSAAPYENCWMTEMVNAIPVDGAVAQFDAPAPVETNAPERLLAAI
jgi:hypothetical protein